MANVPNQQDDQEKTTEELIAKLRWSANTVSAVIRERDNLFESIQSFTRACEILNDQYKLTVACGRVPSDRVLFRIKKLNALTQLAQFFKSAARRRDMGFILFILSMPDLLSVIHYCQANTSQLATIPISNDCADEGSGNRMELDDSDNAEDTSSPSETEYSTTYIASCRP